jgi:hypothetical protein
MPLNLESLSEDAKTAYLAHLKFSDVDSKRMVIHIQGGKGRKDRDVMLSSKCSRSFVITRTAYGENPGSGSFRATTTIAAIISNHRLISFADGQVTFRWRDSVHNNEQKPMTLSLDKFLCRFLLHILPQGFVRIHNFGFLANRRRATLLPLCFHLLGSKQPPQAEQTSPPPKTRPSFGAAPSVLAR